MSLLNKRIIIGKILTLLFLISMAPIQLSLTLPENSTDTIVKVEPALIEFSSNATGQEFTVNVKIINVTNLYGFDIIFSWNTTFLEYVSHSVYVPRNTYPDGILWNPVLPIKDEVDVAAGTYWIAYSSMAPAPSFNGTGIAFNITLKVKYHPVEPEPTANITLELESVDLAAKDGKPIEYVKEEGVVKLLPLPLSYILLKVDPQIIENLSSCTYFDINVLIAGVDQSMYNLTGFSVTLSFNPLFINAINITEGSWTNEYANETMELQKQIDNNNGTLTYALNFEPPMNPNAPTFGTLFKVTFHVISETTDYPPPSCELALGPVSLTDSNLGEIVPQTENGTYVVNRPPPVAKFTWTPSGEYFPVGQNITFDASESYHKLGLNITLYQWNFGGLYNATTTDPVISYLFLITGRREIILNVTDEKGFWNITRKYISILDPPRASFVYSPLTPTVNETIIFNPLYSTNGTTPEGGPANIVSYRWDFGDGTTPIVIDEKINVTYRYAIAGTYNVTLIITNNYGLTSNQTISLTVTKLNSVLTININPENITLGSHVVINGALSPARANANVTIEYQLEGETVWNLINTTLTDVNGNYNYIWTPSKEGNYTIRAKWFGDQNTNPAESETKTLYVGSAPSQINILPYVLVGIAIMAIIILLVFIKTRKKT